MQFAARSTSLVMMLPRTSDHNIQGYLNHKIIYNDIFPCELHHGSLPSLIPAPELRESGQHAILSLENPLAE